MYINCDHLLRIFVWSMSLFVSGLPGKVLVVGGLQGWLLWEAAGSCPCVGWSQCQPRVLPGTGSVAADSGAQGWHLAARTRFHWKKYTTQTGTCSEFESSCIILLFHLVPVFLILKSLSLKLWSKLGWRSWKRMNQVKLSHCECSDCSGAVKQLKQRVWAALRDWEPWMCQRNEGT